MNLGASFEIEDEDSSPASNRKCCSCLNFKSLKDAKGFAILGISRGTVIMSNVFLSTSLLYLASVEAGCLDQNEEECDGRVYGFRPSSLITIIAVISGVLSALLMPITGAIIDFTPHRKLLGIISAAFLITIQVIQIGTVQSTWFPMAILQALAGFTFQVQVLATFAYLPEIGRKVDDVTMTSFSSIFSMLQFGSQSSFLIVVIALSIKLKFNEVITAQLSQTLNSFILIIGFSIAWRKLPNAPRLHELSNRRSLVTAGFIQNWHTAKGINTHYGDGLRWFFISLSFSAAGTDAFSTVSVTLMYNILEANSSEIGIVFLMVLVCSIPGSKIAGLVSKRTNPVTSLKILLILFPIITAIAALVLTGPERKNLVYIFAVGWGICIGWYYPTGNLIFSLLLPKGQESELTGFFIYSSQIIVWLPPLIFTVMNESGVNLNFGLMSLGLFHLIGLFFLFMMGPWNKVRDDGMRDSVMIHQFNVDRLSKKTETSEGTDV